MAFFHHPVSNRDLILCYIQHKSVDSLQPAAHCGCSFLSITAIFKADPLSNNAKCFSPKCNNRYIELTN